MASKTFRLKVKKIPLTEDIVYKKPNFQTFGELHLDLLENKNKLKKNPPKPIYVKPQDSPRESKQSDKKLSIGSSVDEDLTLEELEKTYTKGSRPVFSDDDDSDSDSSRRSSRSSDDESRKASKKQSDSGRKEYSQKEFQEEQEAEEDAEEKERKDKAELLFKFMVLKKQYKNIEIPDFTEHSDMDTMKRVYEQIIRQVSLDSSVETYKQYLVGGFMVMEWVSTNWLSLDISGFTQQQMNAMNRYERLLIELGEKNYSTMGSKFPVEVRLLFLIVFNAGIFYVTKMIFSGGEGGTSVMSALFGGMGGNAGGGSGGNNNGGGSSRNIPRAGPKRAMRGPTITPQQVEELTKNKMQNDSDQE